MSLDTHTALHYRLLPFLQTFYHIAWQHSFVLKSLNISKDRLGFKTKNHLAAPTEDNPRVEMLLRTNRFLEGHSQTWPQTPGRWVVAQAVAWKSTGTRRTRTKPEQWGSLRSQQSWASSWDELNQRQHLIYKHLPPPQVHFSAKFTWFTHNGATHGEQREGERQRCFFPSAMPKARQQRPVVALPCPAHPSCPPLLHSHGSMKLPTMRRRILATAVISMEKLSDRKGGSTQGHARTAKSKSNREKHSGPLEGKLSVCLLTAYHCQLARHSQQRATFPQLCHSARCS